MFVLAALPKLLDAEGMREQFQAWGYPVWSMSFIGLVEIVGAASVLFPRLATFGGSVLTIDMISAVGTHIAAAEWAVIAIPVILGALAIYVAWARLPEAKGMERAVHPVRHT